MMGNLMGNLAIGYLVIGYLEWAIGLSIGYWVIRGSGLSVLIGVLGHRAIDDRAIDDWAT
jgi:hypothetical protein